MNLPFFIARRYFLSKKKKSFINIISILSMLVVALATASLVIVLSVFNGMENLVRTLYSTFDPEIKISLAKGKYFEADSTLINNLESLKGVEMITHVIEENALLELRDDKRVVMVKGVSANFTEQKRMDSAIVAGDFRLWKNNRPYAIIGRGIHYWMNVSLNNEYYPLKLNYPKDHKKLMKNPLLTDVLSTKSIPAGGVFAIEKQYDDNYIFTPIEFAQDLFNMDNKRTSIEVKTGPGHSVEDVKTRIQKLLGNEYLVQNSDEQHATLLRAIKVEKLFVYLVFSVLLLMGAVNIFSALTMLSIDKKKDVAILHSMGSSKSDIRKIFLMEGLIIAFTGTAAGLLLGFIICWAQQTFGFVSMGMETSVVDAYPIKMKIEDFLLAGATVLILTVLISYKPANTASKVNIRENL